MKTVRRLLYRQILSTVFFVTVAFLALFFFIDLVDELQRVGRNAYTMGDAFMGSALALPGHVYDVFPITLLIGTIIALSRLAQNSEFTILRTGGLGPARALSLLGGLALAGVALMVSIGDVVMPWSEQLTSLQRAQFRQGQALKLGQGGAWLRERATVDQAAGRQITINIGAALGEGHFQRLRLFEFNAEGALVRRLSAQEARVAPVDPARPAGPSAWTLTEVVDTQWLPEATTPAPGSLPVFVKEQRLPTLKWLSQMSPQVVAASVLPIDTMSTAALWRYTRHLSANAQAAQKYELQFWKKAFSPLACLVMVALALPFAYLQSRSGNISLKVFGGIMLGISFVLANHISSHLGLLHNWKPWLAASLPSMAYLLLSLSAFVWLVRNR